MTINKELEEKKLTLAIEGRVDTVTAPDFEKEIDAIDGEINELVLDCEKLEYTSSAGLRVILKAQKLMTAKEGTMKLINVSQDVKEVLDITGFGDILTIETK